MDNIVLQKTWVQGRPVVVDNLLGTAFTGEAGAHTFKIRGVDAAQETVTISGTITGKLLAANNVTISLSGSIEDGCAVVTLTDECYDVPGRFIFSVYATTGSTTLCLYCAVGNVLRTDSQVIAYPTESLPNITTLMADLEQILADWPADYSQLQSDVSSLKSAVIYDKAITVADYLNVGKASKAAGIGGVGTFIPQNTQMRYVLKTCESGSQKIIFTTYFNTDPILIFYDADGKIVSFVDGDSSGLQTRSEYVPSGAVKYSINCLYANIASLAVTEQISRVSILESGMEDVRQDETLLDKETIIGANKWNPAEAEVDKAINSSGATYTENGYTTSGFISAVQGDIVRWDYVNGTATEGQIISRSATAFKIAEYDESKQKLSVSANWVSLPYTVSNANTKYIRLAVATYPTNSVIFGDSSTAQIRFIPYSATVDFQRIVAIEDNIAILKKAEDITAVIPDTIYGVVGHPFSIYYYQIFKIADPDSYYFVGGSSDAASNMGNRTRFACQNTGTYNINFRVRKNSVNSIASKNVAVQILAESIPSIKAIFIGDSFVDGGKMQAELKHLMGSNLTFYGTRSSNTTDSTGTTQTILDEGRSGWSLADYCTQASKSSVANAFWDGSKFDFGYYMTQNPTFSDATDVFIMSGPNDVVTNIDYASYYQEIVDSIKAYSNTIRIHCMMPLTAVCTGYAWGIRNHGSGEEFRYQLMDYGQKLIDLFTDESQCYVVPTHVNFDRVYNFPRTEVAVNDRTPTLVDVFNDNVHPNEYGYFCMADMVFGHIVANCQDD